PVGILNETHEPPTFLGVERNGVEKEIIPSTWWEAGGAYSGRFANGISYDLALHSGLNVPTDGSNAYRIRSGRQKVAEAKAEDLAVTGRIRYTGVPGLELSLSAMRQSDITQGTEDAGATLLEAHAIYQRGPFGLRALYADWDIDSTGAALLGKDSQHGFYLEPSYALNDSWTVFARYSEYNTTAGFPGIEAVEQLDLGVNWKIHEDVVFKADYQDQSGASDDDGFNLGVGYQF
ncbi:MAG: porin, partial [Gammaproteobacteria bacterium]|nr:porin [Gammaproteobacteria bacterium]